MKSKSFMMRICRILNVNVLILLFLGSKVTLMAQKNENSISQSYFTYQIRTGLNVGGFSPIPLPAEIRKINSFNPKLNLSVEGSTTYKFGEEKKSWRIKAGIKLENKAMGTDAYVKNYRMEIIGTNGERAAGNWTGGVSTQVANSYLTIPISAIYAINENWGYSLGAFGSMLLEKEFLGYVYEGYLREGGPTGNKIVFSEDKTAAYNFSNDLRRFSYGLQLGSYWRVSKHLEVFSDLSFGLNHIFKSDFKTITFTMTPIYLNIGFGYNF